MSQMSTTSLHYINRGYGYAEYGFHAASSAYALAAIMEMIDQNGPDGARLSEYGLMSLVGHFATYGSLPELPGRKFTRNYDPLQKVPRSIFAKDPDGSSPFQKDVAGESQAAGYGRLAALIMESSDPFIKKRGWDFDLFKELHRAGVLPDLGIVKYSEDRDPLEPDDLVGWYGLDAGMNIDLGIFEVEWRLWLQLHMGLEREGGSELRYNYQKTILSDISGAVLGGDDTVGAGEKFIWSSADTTNLEAGLKAGASVKAWIVIPIIDERIKVVDVGISGRLINDRLRMFVNLFGGGSGCKKDADGNDTAECGETSGSEGLKIVDIPFPTKAPFSAGFAQVGTFFPDSGGLSNYHGNLPAVEWPPNFPQMGTEASAIYRGPIPRAAYGGASNNLLAWEFPFTPPIPGGGSLTGTGSITTVAKKVAEEKAEKEAEAQVTPIPKGIFHQMGAWPNKGSWLYAGLPRYTDTVVDPGDNDKRPLVGSGGPNLVVGVVLDEPDFDRGADGSRENEPLENSRLGLTEKMANQQLSVLAKSEVYFLRPTELDWFKRADGQEEYGSAFNPYWQARLVETSHADRAAALMLQQNVDVEGNGGPSWALVDAFFSMISRNGF